VTPPVLRAEASVWKVVSDFDTAGRTPETDFIFVPSELA